MIILSLASRIKNNVKVRFHQLFLLIGASFFGGCFAFHYPPVQKQLFSFWIHRNQVDAIKSTILNEGYQKTREDYPYAGAFFSNYEKKIDTPKIKSDVQIVLTFKNTDTPEDYYRNLGIDISNLDRRDIPEINAEVDRIEAILYEKLVEIAGKENVKRGEKEIYRNTNSATSVPRPPLFTIQNNQ